MRNLLAQIPCDPTQDRTCQVPTGPPVGGTDCSSSPTACPAPEPGPTPPNDPTQDLTVTGTQTGSDPTATGDQFALSPVAASAAGTPVAGAVFTESTAGAPAQLPATGSASLPIAGGAGLALALGICAVLGTRRKHASV